MNCVDFEPLMADALGDELSPGDRRVFEAHLGECTRCRQEYATARRAVGMMRQLPGPMRVSARREGDRLVIEDKPAAGRVWDRPSSLSFDRLKSRSHRLRSAARASGGLFRYAAIVLIAFTAGYALHAGAVSRQLSAISHQSSAFTTRYSTVGNRQSTFDNDGSYHTLRGALVSAHIRNPGRSDLAKCLIAVARTEPSK